MKTKFDILQFQPCSDAVQYYDTQSSFEDAWNNCHKGDWMLWIGFKLGIDIRLLTLAKAHCANTVRHLMKDQRSTDAIDVAIRYGNNEATIEELNAAAYVAYEAANAAYDAAADAAYAAYAAANVANSTDAADAAANAAVNAAYVANAANANTAMYDAYAKNQLQTADICRQYLTNSVFQIIK